MNHITIVTTTGLRATVSRESVLAHLPCILPGQHTINVTVDKFNAIVATDEANS